MEGPFNIRYRLYRCTTAKFRVVLPQPDLCIAAKNQLAFNHLVGADRG
jgi:hypothetical protein